MTEGQRIAYAEGFEAGYRVAKNRALYAVDESRGDPSKPHGDAYEKALLCLNIDREDAIARGIESTDRRAAGGGGVE